MSSRHTWLLLLAVVISMAAGIALPAAAQQANLTYYYHIGLTYPLTPTTTPVTSLPVIISPTMQGNADATYLSFAQVNDGTASMPPPYSVTGLLLDGEGLGVQLAMPLNPGEVGLELGFGPFNVRGGRHTLGYVVDFWEEYTESDETDNVWAHQFVFTPYVLTENTPKSRGTPPERLGGISDVIDGSITDFNCDGFRFTSTSWWNVVTMYAQDDITDYDLELHAPSTGSENGFLGSSIGSFGLSGELDALIVNRNVVGIEDYDVGVINQSGDSQFVIEHVTSEPANVGLSMDVSYGTDDFLRIWDTYIGDTGWVTVAVTDPTTSGGEFYVGWIDDDVTEMGLTYKTDWVPMDDNGEARLHRNFTTTGYFGLVVYREPRGGRLPDEVTVRIEPTPPDFRPYPEGGWHSPLVPTPTVTASGPVALPGTLHGFMPQTYLNFTFANVSNGWSPPVDVGVFQDGMDGYVSFSYPSFAPFVYREEYGLMAWEFPSGRHTLTLKIDPQESVHEIYEGNNIYGEQYCWSPLELALGGQYSHFAPGPAIGGLSTVNPGEPIYHNCDGYRLHTGYAPWEGVVLTQGPNSDFDLIVHHPLEGVKNGFDDYLSESLELGGQTDYVVFNNSQLGPQVFDIGVMNFTGMESYTVEAVASTTLPIPPTGTLGPFHMGASHMLHLHNIYLEPDIYAFRLDNLYGSADWSVALHAHDESLPVRSQSDAMGWSNQNGPGGPEWFTVDAPVASYYCLAVCKATPFGFDLEGEYELTILRGVSDVQDEPDLPTATSLAGIYPNPFNPQTTISYELAAAGVVELAVYDLKGALVRRLVSEPRPAGRHRAVWNGEDESGQRVASGVYLARFKAGSHQDFRKVVMVK